MKIKLFLAAAMAVACTFTLDAQIRTKATDAATTDAVSSTGTTTSGAKYKALTPCKGTTPKMGQEVFMHAQVLDAKGQVAFDSREMGVPIHAQLGKESDKEAKAFDEVAARMCQGGTYMVDMPVGVLADDNPFKQKADGKYLTMKMEVLQVMDARPSGTDLIRDVAEKQGAKAARAKFDALQKTNPKGYTFAEWDMNMTGYDLMQSTKVAEAVEVFKMNTELNPKSWNAYDSLGDGYMALGDKVKAKEAYDKALSIRPQLEDTKEKLKAID